jgi:hypothetical protein
MDDRVYPVIFPPGSPTSPIQRRPTAEAPGTPSRFKHKDQTMQDSGLPPQPMMRDQAQHQRRQIISYGNRQPLKRERSIVAALVVVGYLAALAYYLYVRVMYTLDFSQWGW